MHNLAVLYAEGIDGKPDYGTAAQWFRKAAQRGIADSQYNLGVLCARGLGTEKNLAESYKWFALAAAQGDREAAKKRDEVAAHLDADDARRRPTRGQELRGRAAARRCHRRSRAARRLGSRRRRAAAASQAATCRTSIARLVRDGKTVNKRGVLSKDVNARAFIAKIDLSRRRSSHRPASLTIPRAMVLTAR